MQVLAIFGPTAVGKTGVAIEVAELLRERGEDPVAVSCDSIQVYGASRSSAAPRPPTSGRGSSTGCSASSPVDEEFSAGRFAELAHAEIDQLLAEGRRPIVVGGTGLYLRAALAELELRPPVPAEVRAEVEAEIAERGPEALHAELPPELAAERPPERPQADRPADRAHAGSASPPHALGESLWTERLRHPTPLVGLTIDRDELRRPDRGPGRGDGRRGRRRGGRARRSRPAPRARPGRRSASRSCSRATSRR